MGIELGLSRIGQLLAHAGSPHEKLKVLHVAGTNGKGSVCTYLSTLLQNKNDPAVKIGKFTSPHLVDVTDSIMINNMPIPKREYEQIKSNLSALNDKHLLQCSEFELLTCIAFSYFHQSSCNWCVLEVGLGGRLDATNIVPGKNKYACGITKIGMDHQSFLGSTLSEIAQEKAGIITKGTKYAVVDGSNDESVLDVVREKCREESCNLKITDSTVNNNIVRTKSWGDVKFSTLPLNGEYQIFNFRVAMNILDHLKQEKEVNLTIDDINERLFNTTWPGRLQTLDFHINKNETVPVLLDGAHNGCAALELEKFIRKQYGEQPLTFVTAVTSGKDLGPLFGPLLRPIDEVITTQFSSVDGMPWIKANEAGSLCEFIKANYTKHAVAETSLINVFQSLKSKQTQDSKRPIVVCGSLYLCGEILRMDEENKHKI
ncbi:dihydrofolate synthase [Maudiozyma humilis]|uniref:Dihydrofolate synthetase n=1 Tax=Maudiozyma humilis TaxID=51915 RepID=A0AAV5RQE1_MAUHU|nr:dihydrofolate synthase [Kazachstania humilis]